MSASQSVLKNWIRFMASIRNKFQESIKSIERSSKRVNWFFIEHKIVIRLFVKNIQNINHIIRASDKEIAQVCPFLNC